MPLLPHGQRDRSESEPQPVRGLCSARTIGPTLRRSARFLLGVHPMLLALLSDSVLFLLGSCVVCNANAYRDRSAGRKIDIEPWTRRDVNIAMSRGRKLYVLIHRKAILE